MNERNLTQAEAVALSTVVDHLPVEPGRQMLADLAGAIIESGDSNNNLRWQFNVPGYEPAAVDDYLSIVGAVSDADGSLIDISILVDSNQRILEVDFSRTRPGSAVRPDWTTIKWRNLDIARPLRRPSDGELYAVRRIAELLPTDLARQVLADAASASVEPRSLEDESLLRFHLEGYDRPDKGIAHPVPPMGCVDDADGAKIRVMVFLDSANRLAELELIREAWGEVVGPDWATFRVEGTVPDSD